ncbi:hypothetical protein NGUA39_00003 [Salmonella enterica]|nr:hypothetical protein NGUA39_00003 [Salmonella enterica]
MLHQVRIVLQIDRNNDIGAQRTRQGNGHGIHHRAIDQPVAIMRYGGHQTRNAAGCPDSQVQITFGEPEFPART